MALTKHQLLHLNAVIRDAKEEGNDKALEEAEKILLSGIFPKEEPSQIHDFLEKNEFGVKFNLVSLHG